MNIYKVIGESREVGAIGIFEPFNINIVADSAKDAYEEVRSQLYASNREHVYIKEISLKTGINKYSIIDPANYL